jgi:ankyrin repeat protein
MNSVAQRLGLALPILIFSCLQLSASPKPQNTPDQAVKKALPLLQHASKSWYQGAKCSSCHHQSLTQVAVAVAKDQGFLVDERKSKAVSEIMVSRWMKSRLAHFEGTGDINGSAGNSYNLFGFSAAKISANDASDSEIYYLLSKQATDGSWPSLSHRPPIEDDPFTLTALSLRALKIYAPPALKSESDLAVTKALSWLLDSKPKSTEELTFKLLGLSWGGAPQAELEKVCSQIIGVQNRDGGWSQLPSMASDAYATGQILVAIQTAGGLRATHNAVQNGIRFLVRTQKDDGSWLVETRRRIPGLPYFETGFPHKKHQFISFAGTAWGAMALAIHRTPGWQRSILSTRPMAREGKTLPLSKDAKVDRLLRAALYGSVDEIKGAIAAGADVNGLGIEGATALIYAARDPKKVACLIEKGAKVDAVSNEKTTALHVACGFTSGLESVRLLVNAGAKLDAVNGMGETPLTLAAVSGDVIRTKFLLDKGANPNAESAIAGVGALSAQNVATLRLLIERGLKVNTKLTPDGYTLLSFCVMDGSEAIVNLMLEMGANPNDSTKDGLTVLMYASMFDPGHSRIVENLIRHGAKADAKTLEGKTALSLATKYGNIHLANAIESR